MKALILAAGVGTRLQSTCPGIPKVMLPLGNKPLIERQIEHLKKFGILDFYINIHYLPELIKNHLGSGKKWGVRIHYSYEPVLLGTSGSLNNFVKDLDETFIVLYGDVFTIINLDNFVKFHKIKKSQATLLVHETDHPEDSDLVALDKKKKILKFYISPHKEKVINADLSSAAIYIFEPDVLNFIPEKIPSDFVRDMFPSLLKKGFKMYGYLSSEYTKDMGTPKRYEKVQKDFERLNLT